MVKQLLLAVIFVLAFWPKPILAMASCEELPFGCVKCASALYPVILIHGLGGKLGDWVMKEQNYVDLLEKAGYPRDYIKEYAYADVDGNKDTYDYQGDIRLISADLAKDVEWLSGLSEWCGGGGVIDLVGYSLGGLVAREYLQQSALNFQDHKIRRLITIGTPHQGVLILMVENWLNSIPFKGQFIRVAFNDFLGETFLEWLINRGSHQPLDLNSDAAQEIVPTSQFLQTLNGYLLENNPEYYTICGDIDAKVTQRIFLFTLAINVSLGDGVITKDSATRIFDQQSFENCFSDQAQIELTVLKINDVDFSFHLDLIRPEDLRFEHRKILKQQEVKERVIHLLD